MKTAQQIIDLIDADGTMHGDEIRAVLKDGEALAALGITDEDQGAVEEAYYTPGRD